MADDVFDFTVAVIIEIGRHVGADVRVEGAGGDRRGISAGRTNLDHIRAAIDMKSMLDISDSDHAHYFGHRRLRRCDFDHQT